MLYFLKSLGKLCIPNEWLKISANIWRVLTVLVFLRQVLLTISLLIWLKPPLTNRSLCNTKKNLINHVPTKFIQFCPFSINIMPDQNWVLCTAWGLDGYHASLLERFHLSFTKMLFIPICITLSYFKHSWLMIPQCN